MDPLNGSRHNPVGWLFLRVGELDRAERAFRRHLYLVPDAPGSRANAAVIRLLQGDTATADQEIETLSSVAPGRDHTLRSGAMYALHRGDLTRAKELFQAHARQSPKEAEWAALAYTSIRAGDLSQAQEYLSRAARRPHLESRMVAGYYAEDVEGQQMYNAAELAALRGDAGTAVRLLANLYERGWRDYWFLADGFNTQLGAGLLPYLLRGNPAFEEFVQKMRRSLDQERAALTGQPG